MEAEESLILKFYQNLGKLFYAVAASDEHVRDEEFLKLKEVVKREWLNQDLVDKRLESNAEHAIINTFKWLHEDNEYDAKDCFNSFMIFKNDHESLFTNSTKSLIMKTARSIAEAFAKVNKSELIMMAKLDLELKRL